MLRTLDDAIRAGEPLIDLFATFKDGVDCKAGTLSLNRLGKDIEFDKVGLMGDPRLRAGQVTAEGMYRLFGAKFIRTPLERWDENTGIHCGYWQDAFRWSSTPISHWPCVLDDYVESITPTQPGANDVGQFYEPSFSL
ncbi:MAG: hypothetical protein AAFV69_12420 [Pseudomonadota bacterium]